jgi:hypothetical protein
MLINELFNSNSEPVIEGVLDNPGEQDSPVASAIIRRILLQRTDLLAKYGPERVGAAVDDVADSVGDWDEIGSSDVSGWVRRVEQMLGNMQEQGVSEGANNSGKGLAELQNFAKMNSDMTMAELVNSPKKYIVANAVGTCNGLYQHYTNKKQAGNAEFIKQLAQEIKWFAEENIQGQDSPTLGDLLQGKLGKINFQQGVAEGNYDRDDYYNARQGREYGKDMTATGWGGDGSKTHRDDIFKGQSKRLPADPFARTSGAVPYSDQGRVHRIAGPGEVDEGDIGQLEKDVAAAPVEPIANMETQEKIGGRHDADDFDDMVSRLKKLAGSGPMKTVWDPDRRVYRNMPTAVQPAQQPKK